MEIMLTAAELWARLLAKHPSAVFECSARHPTEALYPGLTAALPAFVAAVAANAESFKAFLSARYPSGTDGVHAEGSGESLASLIGLEGMAAQSVLLQGTVREAATGTLLGSEPYLAVTAAPDDFQAAVTVLQARLAARILGVDRVVDMPPAHATHAAVPAAMGPASAAANDGQDPLAGVTAAVPSAWLRQAAAGHKGAALPQVAAAAPAGSTPDVVVPAPSAAPSAGAVTPDAAPSPDAPPSPEAGTPGGDLGGVSASMFALAVAHGIDVSACRDDDEALAAIRAAHKAA